MSVPVYWLNFNPDAIARGYWSQTLLEDVLARRVWRPTTPLTYDHIEIQANGWSMRPENPDGGVVVIPGDHNADHADAVVDFLNALPWCLVMLTGDEEGRFPWEQIQHPACLVWASGARPGYSDNVSRILGFGYGPAVEQLAKLEWRERDVAVSFAGQVTHQRRHECVNTIRQEVPADAYEITETHSFGNQDGDGLEADEYAQLLARSVAVACPSGPASPDTFRLFEALEAGAVPWADQSVAERDRPGFWDAMFERGVPFPVVLDWHAQTHDMYERACAGYPATNNTVSAWWQEWKRDFVYSVDATCRQLGATEATDLTIADRLSVVMSSSPTIHDPDIANFETTLLSVREQLGDDVEILVGFDGVRPEAESMRAAYDRQLEKLIWKCEHEWPNVLPIVMADHRHQAGTAKQVLERVRTPTLLFVEHDTPIVGEIDWPRIVDLAVSSELHSVRLHHSTAIGDYHQHLMLDREPRDIGGVPVIRTTQWSQRPHIANVAFYRRILRDYFGEASRCHIETVMHSVCQVAWTEYGYAGWDRFRLGIYSPADENIQRSIHLDSGKGGPVFEEIIAYDHDPLDGAPLPGAR